MMPPQNQQNSSDYDASKIKRFEPREHVRMRPGMYIGGTDKKALHHMVWEVLVDAISEFENKIYNEITVSLLPDNAICISDNGQGLPLHNTEHGLSVIELVMTQIGIGGRDYLRKCHFPISGGWHGVGIEAVNALSSFCQIEVKRSGFLWRQRYHEGKSISPLEQIRPIESDESTGTSISFRPDFNIMEENDFDFFLIAKRCEQFAYLLPHLRFNVEDLRGRPLETTFYHPQGLIEWLRKQVKGMTAISEPLTLCYRSVINSPSERLYTVKVDIAFQWMDCEENLIAAFVNTIETPDGGTHLDGLISGIEKQFSDLTWDKLQVGFVGIIHISHPDPQFESISRIHLLNLDVISAVEEAIEALFAANPEAKDAIRAHFKS
jgi:DNA gyrase subunit B